MQPYYLFVKFDEIFYYLLESGFGKPQRAQRTQRKITTLCALRVLCG